MKSGKANDYLRNNLEKITINPKTNEIEYMIWPEDAIRGVEIAEKDMIEKAVKAFAETCEMYAGNERCLECVKCKDCERVKEFRQKMMEE